MSSFFGTPAEVEAARAKRRKEIQEWARQGQADADALLNVVATPTNYFDEDVSDSWFDEDLAEERIESIKVGIAEARDGDTRDAEDILDDLGLAEDETIVEPVEPEVEAKPEPVKAVKKPAKVTNSTSKEESDSK